MKVRNLYRYKREDGGVTISPIKPVNTEYSEGWYRLIADEGKLITDGVYTYSCIDVEGMDDSLYEVEAKGESL